MKIGQLDNTSLSYSVRTGGLGIRQMHCMCACFSHARLFVALPGSSVRGIFQARILEWVVLPSSGGSSQPRDQTCVSCISRQIPYHGATKEA